MNKASQKSIQGNSYDTYIVYAAYIIFAIALLMNLRYSFVGIDNYLLENYAFRQTQTALTSLFFCKEGFKLAYETPVAGAPWAIPFEFPLYQYIVSFIKNMSGGNMDVIGRLVSLVFFYGSLVYAFLLIKRYTKNMAFSLLALSLVLLHPIYIFWSRSFMIESTVLFFCLMYMYHLIMYMENKSYVHMALGLIGGLAAALVKITTLMPIIFFMFAIVMWEWYKEKGYKFNMKTTMKYAIYGVVFFLIPFLAILWWTKFSDHLKSLNAYAYEFTSSTKLNSWNFGTWEQKTTWKTWKTIGDLSQVSHKLFYLLIVVLAVWGYFAKVKYYKQAISCLIIYAVTPMIFTNLHFIHEYYAYSNSIFLCGFIGFAALSLIEDKNVILKVAGLVYVVGTLYFFVGRYKDGYYKVQTSHPNYVISTAQMVKERTKPTDVIMVYGNDWGSEYAYYTERKTIALRNTFNSVKDTAFVKLMEQNKGYNINTLVFVTYYGLFNNTFVNELINYTGFKPVLQQEPYFIFQRDTLAPAAPNATAMPSPETTTSSATTSTTNP